MDRQDAIPQGVPALHDHHDLATTRPPVSAPPHSHSDMTNAFQEAPDMVIAPEDSAVEDAERHSKTSQRSDDSFSAYIEHHPIRQLTPPSRSNHVTAAKGTLEDILIHHHRRDSTQGADSVHSACFDEGEEDFGDASWPTTVDHEEERQQCDDKPSRPHSTIIIPEMEVNDEDEGDTDLAGKKRRRRTNKAEATVLASVFAQTQFPDAQTREALAQRLKMKPKAVSIWFQNRRQAMKKRASRFGGVEGVNGPTVTAASIQVLDVRPRTPAPYREARDLSTERLKRWMSLDDVAMNERKPGGQVELMPQADVVCPPPRAEVMENKLSSAPILDFICKQKGRHQLSRMASMPSLASLISAQQDTLKAPCQHKDLRDLLPCRDVQSLHRRRSVSSLLAHQATEKPVAKISLRERCFSLQMNNDGRAAVSNPSSEIREAAVTGRAQPPSMIFDMLRKPDHTGAGKIESIWQRMQSSSSASDSHAGSSDKENRDPNLDLSKEEGEEDEERTLRLIAGKRAAKEVAKKEKMLSEEGRRYIEEADARIALLQRKRPSFSNVLLAVKKDKSRIPTSVASRKWNRAVSDAQVTQRNAFGLTRVPSLDLTAGRDRSKDNGRLSFRSVSEMRLAKRPYHGGIFHDENRLPSMNLQARLTQQQKKRSRHSHSVSMDLHMQSKAALPRTPLQPRTSNYNLLRPFAMTNSLPTPALSLLSSRLGTTGSFSNIPASARESSARLDGARPVPSSQESSENGSDDWLEAWAQERSTGPEAASRLANVLRDRSGNLNAEIALKAVLPVARHDDSGFFGSESGGEYDEEMQAGRKASKRKLVSQGSSSPSKRSGDDRDRLAAETLLGLGSRS